MLGTVGPSLIEGGPVALGLGYGIPGGTVTSDSAVSRELNFGQLIADLVHHLHDAGPVDRVLHQLAKALGRDADRRRRVLELDADGVVRGA
ncbi:hypothetical protein MKK75_13705 [Methylobacterium sp. J-030]|nr:hypothetical protein [Methylobacterium sp. J-030]